MRSLKWCIVCLTTSKLKGIKKGIKSVTCLQTATHQSELQFLLEDGPQLEVVVDHTALLGRLGVFWLVTCFSKWWFLSFSSESNKKLEIKFPIMSCSPTNILYIVSYQMISISYISQVLYLQQNIYIYISKVQTQARTSLLYQVYF